MNMKSLLRNIRGSRESMKHTPITERVWTCSAQPVNQNTPQHQAHSVGHTDPALQKKKKRARTKFLSTVRKPEEEKRF